MMPLRMRSLLSSILIAVILLLSVPAFAQSSTTAESDIIFTIQTDTVLQSTSSARFSNSSSTSSSSIRSTSSSTRSSSAPPPPPTSSSSSSTPAFPPVRPTSTSPSSTVVPRASTSASPETPSEPSTPPDQGGDNSGNGGQNNVPAVVTSIALSTYTIPLSGGGVTTSTAYAVPAEPEPSTTRAPTLQDGAGFCGKGDLKDVGFLGALIVAAWNIV